jgi:ketosteroid isomerase-like protein
MDAGAAAVTNFTWAPERASVSAAGDLGYTVGRFSTRVIGPDGVEVERTGLYLSIWRRQADGSWKVEMDLGNPLTEPTPVSDGSSVAGG